MVTIAVANVKVRELASFAEFELHLNEHFDAAAGADILVFPELVGCELLSLEPDFADLTPGDMTRLVPYADRFFAYFERQAAKRKQYVLAGSQLVAESDGSIRNRSVLFGPTGPVASHDKTHFFPAEGETPLLLEGDEITVVDLPFGRVGIAICYEIQFPAVAQAAADRGADIILNPSMTFSESGSWRVLHCAHARAIENQIFVAAAQLHSPGFGPFGAIHAQSAILSPADAPWRDHPTGTLASTELNEEATVSARVDLADLYWARENGDVRNRRDRDRRAAVYERWSAETAGSISGEPTR